MTGRFEDAYAAAGERLEDVPWVHLRPNRALVQWLSRRPTHGGRALVVGCGVGDDAAHLAEAGYAVTAFDIAPTAIARARERFPAPDHDVDFRVADWFDLPAEWRGTFDLVVEIGNVQALPDRRAESFERIGEMVAPGGTLLVRCFRADPAYRHTGPPWPVTRAELAGAERAGLRVVSLDEAPGGGGSPWWTAELVRDAGDVVPQRGSEG